MNTQLTLKEGLIHFREKNKKYFTKKTLSAKQEKFMDAHDIAHVLFSCDTSITGEGTVKIWTTFGTDLNFWEVTAGYNDVNAFQLFREYSIKHLVKNMVQLFRRIPQTFLRARQMSKKWSFYNYHKFLNTPIKDIRSEFNIHI